MAGHLTNGDTIRLIINADDYGYFASVSRGILEAVKTGMISATGIMSNSNCFDEQVDRLQTIDSLDIGVHLNLTYGHPLSTEMKTCLKKWGGSFPGKFNIVMSLLAGKIKLDSVIQEFRLQIERCLNKGFTILFLNSHEHIHMLPPIFSSVVALAKQYQIPFIRYSKAEWMGKLKIDGFMRNLVFQVCNSINFMSKPKNSLTLIGMGDSGKLNLNYIERQFSNLKPGRIYELMCHPGFFDSEEITEPRLICYHNWEAEYELLQSTEMQNLCERYGVKITRYSNIINNVN